MLDGPGDVAAQPLLDAALGDQRRHDDQAAVTQAQAVVRPGTATGVDRLLGEPLAEPLREPPRHLLARDAKLAGVGVEAAVVAIAHAEQCTRSRAFADNRSVPVGVERGVTEMSDTEETGGPPAPLVTNEPVEIAAGVFVIPDGRIPLVPNIGIVLGERAALVVDTAMGPRNGETVLRHARALAGDRPLILTVTHFHPEHGFGAQVFAGEATIVYNRAQLEELHDKGAAYVEMFKGFGPSVAAQLEGVELVEPDIVYDGEADIDLGGRLVQLRTWGLAHTRSDQVVYLPEERVLFAGDLVETRLFPIFPYFPPDDAEVDGSRWIEVLERLVALAPAIVVPGHGEVGDADLVPTVRDFLVLLRGETARLVGERHANEAIVATLEPAIRARYPDWESPEWIGFGIRCFADAARRSG